MKIQAKGSSEIFKIECLPLLQLLYLYGNEYNLHFFVIRVDAGKI